MNPDVTIVDPYTAIYHSDDVGGPIKAGLIDGFTYEASITRKGSEMGRLDTITVESKLDKCANHLSTVGALKGCCNSLVEEGEIDGVVSLD